MEIKILASGSTGNCYRISDGETPILLDAGIPFKQIQQGLDFKVSEIKGCFITHSHGDHSKAATGLLKMGVDVYTSPGTISACSLSGHRVKPINALQTFDVGTFTVTAFDVQHDAPEPLGFSFSSRATGEKLLYFTDTFYLKYRFSGLTHIMGEANYDMESIKRSVAAGYIPQALVPRILKSHMSLEHFLDLLRANDLSRVQQIYLLHLSCNNSNSKLFKESVQRLTGTEVYVC